MFKYLRNNFIVYYLYSYIAGMLYYWRFRHVHSLLLFIGYPRSGSSTLGSLLDAHKNILIAHEFNILKYIRRGYNFKQLFYLLAKNSRQFTRKGRISAGYDGTIIGQYNGKASPCLIIGDKNAGATCKMLEYNDYLHFKLLHFFPTVKLIHIVRNPFDMIASEAYKGNEKHLKITEDDLTKSIQFYSIKFRTIDRLIKKGKMNILTIKHEELLEKPEKYLTLLLDWLKVDNYSGYIDACKAHLFQKPHQSRHSVTWSDDQFKKVNDLIVNYTFLNDYSFEK